MNIEVFAFEPTKVSENIKDFFQPACSTPPYLFTQTGPGIFCQNVLLHNKMLPESQVLEEKENISYSELLINIIPL